MNLKIELDSGIIFMKMAGSLVASEVELVKEQVQKLKDKKYLHIVFDMSRVDFVDSSGLGLCIVTAKELASMFGVLVCAGLQDNARKLFAMTRADQKIKILPSRVDAYNYVFALLHENPADTIAIEP